MFCGYYLQIRQSGPAAYQVAYAINLFTWIQIRGRCITFCRQAVDISHIATACESYMYKFTKCIFNHLVGWHPSCVEIGLWFVVLSGQTLWRTVHLETKITTYIHIAKIDTQAFCFQLHQQILQLQQAVEQVRFRPSSKIQDKTMTLQIRDEEAEILKECTYFLLLTKHLNTWCDCTHLNEPHRTFSDTGKWNCDCIFVNYEYGVLWSPYSTYSHIRHFLLINTFPHPI